MIDPSIPRVQSTLERLPDAQLTQMLRGGASDVPPFLVMAELERRKSMRSRAGAQTPPSTMVSELTDGGGIAKFAEGGAVQADPTGWSWGLRQLGRPFAAMAGGARQLGQAYEDYLAGIGRSVNRAEGPLPPTGPRMTPQEMERQVKVEPELAPGIPVADTGGIGGMPPAGGGGGFSTSVQQAMFEREPVPEVKDLQFYRDQLGPTPQITPVTDEQREAIRSGLQKNYGYDWSKERAAQDERRAGVGQMKEDAKNQALLKLGLGMMATRRRNGLAAIGEAGGPALDFYIQAQQAARAEAAAIQRGDMEIARAANAEKLRFLGMAQEQAAGENTIKFRNATLLQGGTRDALTAQKTAQEQADAALRYNRGLAREEARTTMALNRPQRPMPVEMAFPPERPKVFEQVTEQTMAELAALQQRYAGKGKMLTPEEHKRMKDLLDPAKRQAEIAAQVNKIAPMYMKRGGLPAAAEAQTEE